MLLDQTGAPPERMTTDKLGSYAAAKQRVPELGGGEHQQVRSRMRCNNIYGLLPQGGDIAELSRGSDAVVYPASSVERSLRATMEFAHRVPIESAGLESHCC